MDLEADERPAESPLIESIWYSQTDLAGDFISIAANLSELVITRRKGTLRITLRGPETRASAAFGPDEAEYIGILFKLGTFMPDLPIPRLVDGSLDLPQAGANSFWLNGTTWEVPRFDNADSFVTRLIREGLLVHDPLVDSVMSGQSSALSLRSEQRRFLQATGLSYATVRQIERARQATRLLKQGVSILDTVYEVGYFDQPHLTRSLRRYIGLTPAQIMDAGRAERLSFLYKTAPLD